MMPKGLFRMVCRQLFSPSVQTLAGISSHLARLFCGSLRARVEKKFAHLAGDIAGDSSLLRPCKRLIQIGGFQDPESAHVFLGLGVRTIGDDHPSVGLLPERLRV